MSQSSPDRPMLTRGVRAVVRAFATAAALSALVLGALPAASAPAALTCATGPVNKIYGNTPWLVYSCSDNRSVMIIAAAGSPATPFYFMFTPRGAAYQIFGEGTGRKDVTDAALAELNALSSADIAGLIEQTRRK